MEKACPSKRNGNTILVCYSVRFRSDMTILKYEVAYIAMIPHRYISPILRAIIKAPTTLKYPLHL